MVWSIKFIIKIAFNKTWVFLFVYKKSCFEKKIVLGWKSDMLNVLSQSNVGWGHFYRLEK